MLPILATILVYKKFQFENSFSCFYQYILKILPILRTTEPILGLFVLITTHCSYWIQV